jgi:sugar phosphate isomerase/epimerase
MSLDDVVALPHRSAGAGSPLPRAQPSASPSAQPAVRGTGAPVGLSTASVYPHTCAEAFGMAAELGYDGVEVMVWTDPVSQDVAALGRLAEYYGMPVLAIHAPTLLLTQRVWGREPWPKLERSCQMAVQLSARTVVAHPPFRWQREYAAGFAAGVDRICDRYEVALAIENMYPWRAGQREMLAYLPGWDPVPQPYRHVTLDLSHSATAGTSGLDLAVALGDRLAHLHLADGSGSAKDEHLVPGRGSQPCGDVLGLLAQRDWRGTVVVEVNTRRARSRAERETDLAESLAFARLHLAAAAEGAAGPR